jgi:hypothetical protein
LFPPLTVLNSNAAGQRFTRNAGLSIHDEFGNTAEASGRGIAAPIGTAHRRVRRFAS